MKLVAFLRAVNVGGRVVKMDALRDIFLGLGLKNVETFIASGNVIFDASPRGLPALERKIEKALEAALKYDVTTFIRSMPEVARIATHKPFADGDGETLFIGFLSAEPEAAALKKLSALTTPIDHFRVDRTEVYWQRGSRDSEMTGGLIEKALGIRATFRNANTIRRIAEKYAA